jgi:hypothetical protein
VADESPWPAPRMKPGGSRIWFLNRPDLWPNIEYGMIYESRRPLVDMGSAKSGSLSSESLTESLRSLLFEGLEFVDHMTCHFEVQTLMKTNHAAICTFSKVTLKPSFCSRLRQRFVTA